MVAVGGDSRFYARASMSKHPMDVQEIRSSFALSTDVPNLVRRRRDDRLGRILADDTPVVLSGSDRLVVHLIPFASVGTDQAMVLPPWTQPALAPPGASGHSHRYNIDGVLSHDGGTNRAPQAYLQVFRTGFLEAVQSDILRRSGDGLFLPPRSVEETVLECLESYLMRCAANGVDAPIVVAVSLLAVRGAQVPPTYRRHIRPFPFERDVMLLPEIILNSVPTAVATAMRPCFDALSQAFGISRSLSYDEHGHWATEFQW